MNYDPFIDYAGFKDGVCITIATKHTGARADKINARIVADMMADGCQEVKELPLHEAVRLHRIAIGAAS